MVDIGPTRPPTDSSDEANAEAQELTENESSLPKKIKSSSKRIRTLNGCKFAYGRGFENNADYSSFDYVSIWIGTVDSNGSTHFNKVRI